MDFSRRQFLQSAGAGGALAVQAGWSNTHAKGSRAGTAGQQHHGAMPRYGMRHRRHGWKSHGGTLSKFVDRLPVPSATHPSGTLNSVPLYRVAMRQCHQRLHRDLPPTTLWGYDGQYPGSTFDIRRGQPIAVRWLNDLPSAHLLPVASTIHGAESPTPEVRTVVHVHGLKVLPESDGDPEAWITKGFAQTGPDFRSRTYFYPTFIRTIKPPPVSGTTRRASLRDSICGQAPKSPAASDSAMCCIATSWSTRTTI